MLHIFYFRKCCIVSTCTILYLFVNFSLCLYICNKSNRFIKTTLLIISPLRHQRLQKLFMWIKVILTQMFVFFIDHTWRTNTTPSHFLPFFLSTYTTYFSPSTICIFTVIAIMFVHKIIKFMCFTICVILLFQVKLFTQYMPNDF